MSSGGGRNIVVLMDGTSNQIDDRHTNVLRLFRVCAKNAEQLVFYHPGVGTVARDSAWQSFRQKTASIAGLAFGYGLDENVVEAYAYLVEHWRPGDRVFLFGFSRGAWTVRVLAGLIHTVGLMRPGELHLVDHALGAYKRGAAKRELPYAWRFGRVVGSVRMPIWFLGCFDTVASVIVPRPDRAYVPSLEELPYTHENPSVMHFRHALAIDERRRMFRPAPWDPGQTFRPYLAKHSRSAPQDVEEMWFAGVHGDVGGGYPEADSALAKIPLAWMLEEAEAKGLKVMRGRVNRLGLGRRHRRSVEATVAPDPLADMHESLTTGWWPLELLPRRASQAETRTATRGLYLPRGERRAIPSGASIHPSVRARVAKRADYDPPNLP
ncbi:DUF2235 domain-containing protein [Qipengyuania flava]|jgi:uncharacterized protein (DUF2235 family)|uniref:DUF2235 domain-containing protein n=1 Tax=Qipengyuania flava TaxID=192812 RepID=UPI001C57D9AC|nr:DUF2235 domain-containing protein [Qipengyuania flava]MBW3169407.1 DUF2235 domain-containing protein [Qipengyuania flava]MBY5966645.1 DUF2235 domain-containing protein [Qipengyuania flava]MBY6012969.1 DUF2235 domain-containing protein [Qipengyuania flava]MBY6027411.1 DUF2235 domain-containing protein [Qipengyuania flava]